VGIGGFAVFFRGVAGKAVFLMWCFCGEVMVNCVVVVEKRHHVSWRLKTCHELEVYFRAGVEKPRGLFRIWEWCTDGLKGLRFFALIRAPLSL
jgi:hypothetical protein